MTETDKPQPDIIDRTIDKIFTGIEYLFRHTDKLFSRYPMGLRYRVRQELLKNERLRLLAEIRIRNQNMDPQITEPQNKYMGFLNRIFTTPSSPNIPTPQTHTHHHPHN